MKGRRWALAGIGSLALLWALLWVATAAQAAPWASPGTGITYSPATLETSAGGSITNASSPGFCEYRFHDPVTISGGDTLGVPAGCQFTFDTGDGLFIQGRLFVNGTKASPVRFIPTVVVLVPGLYPGVTFDGAAFARSFIDNLSVNYSTFVVRCDACRGLSIHNLSATGNSGDLVQIIGGGSDVVAEDITMNISSYASQSVLAMSQASNVTGRNITAPWAAVALLVWNASNVTVLGPISSLNTVLATVWVDNATGVNVTGATGRNGSDGARVTQSQGVSLRTLNFDQVANAFAAANVVSLSLDGMVASNVTGTGVLATNLTGAVLANITLVSSSAGVNIAGSTNVSLFNASASTSGSALSVASTVQLVARNLTLNATTAAVVQLTNVTDAQMMAAAASGGRGSFFFINSTDIRLEGFTSTSSQAQGVLVNRSNGVALKDGRIVTSVFAGLDVRASSNFTGTNVTVLTGLADGISISSASTASFDNSTSSLNLGHGLIASDSSLNGSWLLLESNGRDGLRLSNTGARLFHLEADRNGGNGTTALGSSAVSLDEGRFENNSAYGLWSAGPTAPISWVASGGFNSIANNPARIFGFIQVRNGGRLDLLNTALRLGGNATWAGWVEVRTSGVLWMDSTTLDRDSPAASYSISVTGSMGVLRSTISNGSMAASQGTIDLESSLVQSPLAPVSFDLGSAGGWANSTIADSVAGALTLDRASDLTVFNMSIVRSAGAVAVRIDNGSIWRVDTVMIVDSAGSGVGVYNGSNLLGLSLTVQGSPGCALCFGSFGSADLVVATLETTGTGPAVFAAPVGTLYLSGVDFVAPSGSAMDIDGGVVVSIIAGSASGVADGFTILNVSIVTLSDLRITSDWRALVASVFSSISISQANWTSSYIYGIGADVWGPGTISIANSTIVGLGIAASVQDATFVTLRNVSLTGGNDGAAGLYAANVGFLQLLDSNIVVGDRTDAVLLTNVSGLADRVDIVGGDGAVGLMAARGVLSLFNLTIRLGASGGTGVYLLDADAYTARNISISNGGNGGGFVIDTAAGVAVDRLTVVGGASGLRAWRAPGLAVGNSTFSNVSTALHIEDSADVSIDEIAISGASVGLSFETDSAATVRGARIEGAATGLSLDSSSAAVVDRMTALNTSDDAVLVLTGARATIYNSTIEVSTPSHSVHATDGFVSLYDTFHTNSTFLLGGVGTVSVFWSLSVRVQSGSTPMANLNVTVVNATGASGVVASDSLGIARAGYLLEFRQMATGRQYASPYRANASLPSGVSGQVSFDLDRPQVVNLTLIDIQPPSLAARPQVRTTVGRLFAFGPVAGDSDNVAIIGYLWNFTNETGALRTFSSTTGSYTFAQPGHYPFEVTAFDASGNRNSTTFDVWVNAAPFFTLLPVAAQLEGLVNLPLAFTLQASDPDPQDVGALTFNLSGEPGMVLTGASFSWTPQQSGNFLITVSVSDGYDRATSSLNLFVSSPGDPSNRLPEFITEPLLNADLSRPYQYDLEVVDPDAGDTVIVQLINGTPGMTLQQFSHSSQAILSWLPSAYFQRGADAFTVLVNVSLRAWDTHGFTYQNFTIRLRNPPDEPPEILNFTVRQLAPGDVVIIDLRQFMNDSDDALSDLRWSIRKGASTADTVVTFDTEDPFTVIIQAPRDFAGQRSFFITFVLTDPSGLNDTMTTEIVLVAPSLWDTILPWLLLIILVGGAGTTYALMTRQRGALPSSSSPASPTSGATTSAPAPSSAAAGADAGFPFLIEGAVLLDAHGAVLAKATIPDVSMGEAFAEVGASWGKATKSPAGAAVFKIGQRDGAGVAARDGAVVAIGRFAVDPSPWLAEPLQESVTRLESHGSDLASVASQPIVHEVLRELLGLSAGATAASVAAYSSAEELRIASVVEMVGGMVRLKVAVDNNTKSLAADVRLSLDYDDKVLRLERSEPSYETKREKLLLGNIRPKERKTVAFYFDPQICTRSLINATVAYDDAAGRFHSAAMKTRPVEVVCPAFSTVRKASTAMLKRLLREELAFRDSKYFRFPAETPAPRVFEGAKQAVMAQDLQLVRELVREAPFEAEAWFYGETAKTKAPMVVWTTVYGTERVTQFSVASSSSAAITGLLAELGRRLVEGRAGGGVGAPIQSFARSKAEKEIGERASLLSKSESGELDSKEH